MSEGLYEGPDSIERLASDVADGWQVKPTGTEERQLVEFSFPITGPVGDPITIALAHYMLVANPDQDYLMGSEGRQSEVQDDPEHKRKFVTWFTVEAGWPITPDFVQSLEKISTFIVDDWIRKDPSD